MINALMVILASFLKKNKKGFTLIELLVVIAIIGLLASITFVSVNKVRIKARDAQRELQLKQICNAIYLYYADHGYYPWVGQISSDQCGNPPLPAGQCCSYKGEVVDDHCGRYRDCEVNPDDKFDILQPYLQSYMPSVPNDNYNPKLLPKWTSYFYDNNDPSITDNTPANQICSNQHFQLLVMMEDTNNPLYFTPGWGWGWWRPCGE